KPIALQRSSLSERLTMIAPTPSSSGASGRARSTRKAMPPNVKDCAVTVNPRRITLRKPKTSRSRAMVGSGRDAEWNIAPGDVAVDGQDLPAQLVGAGRQSARRGLQNLGRRRRRHRQRLGL